MRIIYFVIPASILFIFSCQKQFIPVDALVIRDANIINVENGELDEELTIIIVDNRIQAIGSKDDFTGKGAKEIDASGKYIIPGLWDMHVHTWRPDIDNKLNMMIANGITGFRETWGDLQLEKDLRREMQEGKRPVLRMVVAGNLVDGENPWWPGSIVADTPERGIVLVDSLKAAGVAFVKVYSKLKPEVFNAIAKRCSEVGLPFAGHVPKLVKISDASDAGMKSMEHMYGILEGASTKEDWIIEESKEIEKLRGINDSTKTVGRKRGFERNDQMVESYDDQKALKLYEKLKQNETWQVPTLVANRGDTYMNDPEFRDDSRLKYMPKGVIYSWFPKTNRFAAKRTTEDWEIVHKVYIKQLEAFNQLQLAGVPVLAGTDPLNPWIFYGFSLHDELSLFVENGMTPFEALQTATLNPARYLDATDSLGTVEIGKLADLVILDSNPLEDIRNTSEIFAVITNGQYLDRNYLDKMLLEIEKENNKLSIAETLYDVIQKKGVDVAVKEYHRLKKESPEKYNFKEVELNALGYRLMSVGKFKAAIAILKLNSEIFPASANCFDSLGEAYSKDGQINKAIESYQEVLNHNPDDFLKSNAERMLIKLSGEDSLKIEKKIERTD